MDTRAELLLDELATLPVGRTTNFAYWRDRFHTLFAETLDQETRIALLQAYAVLIDALERALASRGEDLSLAKNVRIEEWSALCVQEALHIEGTDRTWREKLAKIILREIGAGRLPDIVAKPGSGY